MALAHDLFPGSSHPAHRPQYQPSLFAAGPVAVGSFDTLERTWLDAACWVDVVRGWLGGADELFEELAATLRWSRGRRLMYGELVDEPRLSAGVALGSGLAGGAIDSMADALGDHYCVLFDSAWANYYTSGSDSVAWHGDRVGRYQAQPIVAVVSLGGPRRFLLRPKGGGGSLCYEVASGDLLVMGGRCQQRFEHSVPKARHAPPRISVSFRHNMADAPSWVTDRRLPPASRPPGGR